MLIESISSRYAREVCIRDAEPKSYLTVACSLKISRDYPLQSITSIILIKFAINPQGVMAPIKSKSQYIL